MYGAEYGVRSRLRSAQKVYGAEYGVRKIFDIDNEDILYTRLPEKLAILLQGIYSLTRV
jgi:hypothetical protein